MEYYKKIVDILHSIDAAEMPKIYGFLSAYYMIDLTENEEGREVA